MTNRDTTTDFSLRVFSKNGCPMCVNLKKNLDRKDIPYIEFNVEEDTDALPELNNMTPMEYVTNSIGSRQMPTTEVLDEHGSVEEVFSGLRPDRILGLSQR